MDPAAASRRRRRSPRLSSRGQAPKLPPACVAQQARRRRFMSPVARVFRVIPARSARHATASKPRALVDPEPRMPSAPSGVAGLEVEKPSKIAAAGAVGLAFAAVGRMTHAVPGRISSRPRWGRRLRSREAARPARGRTAIGRGSIARCGDDLARATMSGAAPPWPARPNRRRRGRSFTRRVYDVDPFHR